MAFYPFTGDSTLFEGRILRQGLDNYRLGVQQLQRVKGILQQATDAQIATMFGFADSTVAAAAKAELLADIPDFTAATTQMLAQFG